MADEDKMYNMICREKFEELKADTQKILKLLQGNGDIGLIDQVRENTKARESVEWTKKIIFSAFIVQSVILIFVLVRELLTGST